jgi:hypothetical protein
MQHIYASSLHLVMPTVARQIDLYQVGTLRCSKWAVKQAWASFTAQIS